MIPLIASHSYTYIRFEYTCYVASVIYTAYIHGIRIRPSQSSGAKTTTTSLSCLLVHHNTFSYRAARHTIVIAIKLGNVQ
jgi:hypothetical protein